MARKFLTVQQALAYFDEIESDEFSDDPEIVCLPPEPAVDTGTEELNENDLGDLIPIDISGEVEVKIKNESLYIAEEDTKNKVTSCKKNKKRKIGYKTR